ncbi:unnamed protein product [Rhodiola kirilowii]
MKVNHSTSSNFNSSPQSEACSSHFDLRNAEARFLCFGRPSTALLAFCLLCCCVNASVHEYVAEAFANKGNAFVVHGGSEGVYASAAEDNETSLSNSRDSSFIRFEKVTFKRLAESSNLSSWPVHAVVFEVEDRELIGAQHMEAKERFAALQT